MSSRELILNKLRGGKRPFSPAQPDTYIPVSPVNTADVLPRFVREAELLSSKVYQPADLEEALEMLLGIIGDDQQVLAWDDAELPLPNLAGALAQANVAVSAHNDASVRVGITGADAALAGTGTLVYVSGNGRYRATSLLPPVHVALINRSQIVPNLESWVESQYGNDLQAFQHASNVVLISGASRTADIALELILGMHGPGEMHIFILPDV